MHKHISYAALIVALIALLLVVLHPSKVDEASTASKKETAYERVMRTRVLRCGYNLWEPNLVRDANTGKITGAFVDYMEEIGRLAGVNIEWTAQLAWGTFPEDLKTGKADAMCAGIWADAKRGTTVAWTRPIWYNALQAYVRTDDPRFPEGQDHLERLNDEKVTINVLDNTTEAKIASANYPKMKMLTMSPNSSYGEELLSVATHKSDAAFVDWGLAHGFQANDPDHKIRRYAPNENVAMVAQSIAVDIHETELQNMLNAAVQEALNLGFVDRIAHQYDPEGNYFILPDRGYRQERQ